MKTRLEEIVERAIRELEAEERRVALDIEDLRQALEKINQRAALYTRPSHFARRTEPMSETQHDRMHRYETNTDQRDSAPPTNDPEPAPVPATDPVPATEPLPDMITHDDAPIPVSDRQSPRQSENEATETNSDTGAKEDPEVRTV